MADGPVGVEDRRGSGGPLQPELRRAVDLAGGDHRQVIGQEAHAMAVHAQARSVHHRPRRRVGGGGVGAAGDEACSTKGARLPAVKRIGSAMVSSFRVSSSAPAGPRPRRPPGRRDGVDALQPARQVDLGAALGAERVISGIAGLAADRAAALGHQRFDGSGRQRSSSQVARTGKPSPSRSATVS